MAVNRFYMITLLALALLLGYLNYQVFKPFLIPIAWAIVLSVVFYPAYTVALKYVTRRSIASILILCIILFAILGPFSYLAFLLVKEIVTLSESVQHGKFDLLEGAFEHPVFISAIEKITSLLHITSDELEKMITENISRLGKELIGRMTRGVREVITIAFHTIIMAFSIFFFLRDGQAIFQKIYDYMPFSARQKEKLVKQARDMIVTTIYGGVIVALVQGTMGGVAFSIVGISSPVLWGAAMAIASLLPLIGPFIIWAPATVYLFIQGEILKGIALGIIGVLGISTIDNVLRPMIIGNRTRMPFLAIFFSVLGGIKLFGLIGFIMGPLVLAIFVSVIDILKSMD